ncbi:hypothetical protein GCM10008018_70340 [Paenibacillus marchantiophytorum]|uniref:Uncharacterized protein n=1 Tax=Paenibacillus marchantiophytorum TaxID=1619310 RepID=A0ABQ1FID6_9BACL|nr:hypothetical protein GCM10008018_70340 [Paenibacillus marchantiophytorum]
MTLTGSADFLVSVVAEGVEAFVSAVLEVVVVSALLPQALVNKTISAVIASAELLIFNDFMFFVSLPFDCIFLWKSRSAMG